MATFKATTRGERKDGFMQVYIRVSHQKRHGYIKTDKMVTRKELNKQGEIKDAFVINYCTSLIVEYNRRLNEKDITNWSVGEVIDFLTKRDTDLCFSDYARLHADRLIDKGQVRNSRNYLLALQHMERFFGTNRIMFSDLTSTQVNAWIRSLNETRRVKEMYPVCMRQVYRAAVEEYNDYDNDIIRIKKNPWPKVKIPNADRSDKIAISPEECRVFFSAPLPGTKVIDSMPELGRDVAKIVLCLAGINTVDLYELRKENYKDGKICYKRAKTKKSRTDDAYIEMRVEPVIESLFEKYRADDNDPYLFSFHKRYVSSDSFCANVNSGIKQVCKHMGIPKANWYCVYTFRHTWGTVAQNDCGASVSEVGFAMNHSHRSTTITRGYIKIDFTPAWELNAKVIDFIFFSNAKSKQGLAKSVEEPQGKLFRLSPKMMVYARVYFRGEMLGEVSDIGFSNVEEVMDKLTLKLPDTIPMGCAVQYRIKNVDTDREAVYERTKGKGF